MEVKANTANKAGTSQYVNYLDIKLIGIDNLPKDWYDGNSAVNGEAPSFANHPFRYEVRIDFPSNELLTHKEVKGNNENLLQHEQEQQEKYTNKESGKEVTLESGVSNNAGSIKKNTNAPHNANEIINNKKEIPATACVLSENQEEEEEEELHLSLPSLECDVVQSFTFTHGRLLQPLPEYVQYIHHATYTSFTNKTIGYNGDGTNNNNNNNNNIDNGLKSTYTLDGMHNNKNKSESGEEDTDMYAELTSPFELPEELLKYTTEHNVHEETTNCKNNNYNDNYYKDKKKNQEIKEPASSSSPSSIAAKHDTDDDVDVVNSVNTPQLMWICNVLNDIICNPTIHNATSSGVSGNASAALVNVNDSVLSKRRRNRQQQQQQQQSNVASSSISNSSVIMGQSNNTNNGYLPSATTPPPSHMNSNLSNFNMSNVTNATVNSSSNNSSSNNNMMMLGSLNVAPPSILPKRQPSPCVIRIPLTVAQEEYLQYLLYRKIPLVLTLRRMLRPCLPPEWEDYNSFYYEAFIPIHLTQFASPGSRELIEEASLVPCCVNEVMKEAKKKYDLEREKEMMMLELQPPPSSSSLEEQEQQQQQQKNMEEGKKEENATRLKWVNEVSSQEYNTHYPLPHASRNTQITTNISSSNNINTRSLSTSSASKDINTNITSINLTLDNIPSQLNPMEIANFRAKAQFMSASSIPAEHIAINHNNNTTTNTENKIYSHEATHNVNNSGGTVVLSEHERNKRRQALRKNKNNIPVCLYEEVDLLHPHFTHPYVIHHTTAHVSLHLGKTLTKLACDRVRPPITPIQLIPTRIYRSTPSQETSQTQNKPKISNYNAMESFRSSVKAMTWQLIADFKKCGSNHSLCEHKDNSTNSNIVNKDELSTLKCEHEPHAWRRRFMEYFQSSGQLTQFKQMLQPQIMEIIHSTFGIHDIKTWDKSFTAQRNVSDLVNELYVLLMDTVESVLNEVTTTGTAPSTLTPQINLHQQEGKEEHLHTKLKCKEKQISEINESESNKIWLERALEAEMNSDDSWAASCHEAHITRCTEALSRETSTTSTSESNNTNDNNYDSRVKQKQVLLVNAYVEAASFYLRSSTRFCGYHNCVIGNKSKAEVCYREAIAINPRIPITLIHYALFLMSYKRLDEAAVYIHGALDILTGKHNNNNNTEKKKMEDEEVQLTGKEMCEKNQTKKLYRTSDEATTNQSCYSDGITTQYEAALAWGVLALWYDLRLFALRQSEPMYAQDKVLFTKEQRLAFQQGVCCYQEYVSAWHDDDNNDDQNAKGKKESNVVDLEIAEKVIFAITAETALRLRHHDLANICLTHCTCVQSNEAANNINKDGNDNDAVYFARHVEGMYARMFAQTGQLDEAMAILRTLHVAPSMKDELHYSDKGEKEMLKNIDSDSVVAQIANDNLLLIGAMCEEAAGHTAQAIKGYKQVLCVNLEYMPYYMTYLQTAHGSSDLNENINNEICKSINNIKITLREAGKHISLIKSPCLCVTPEQRTEWHVLFAKSYVQLGNLLLAEGKFRDALGVFTLGIQCWPLSIMWLGAAIAYYHCEVYQLCEVCLNESNILNPYNARTWTYIALLLLEQIDESNVDLSNMHDGNYASQNQSHANLTIKEKEIIAVLEQVKQHSLHDPEMWCEVGIKISNKTKEGYMNKYLLSYAERCLRYALQEVADNIKMLSRQRTIHQGENAEYNAKKNLEKSEWSIKQLEIKSKYYLAHVLHAQDASSIEAEKLLKEVSTKTKNSIFCKEVVDKLIKSDDEQHVYKEGKEKKKGKT